MSQHITTRRSRRSMGAVALLAFAIAACQGAGTPTAAPGGSGTPVAATGTPAAGMDNVNFHMAFRWPLSQQYSVFLVGADKGIYAKHGINPTFVEGTGSAATAQLLASGQGDFAAAVDAGSAMRAISTGAQIQIIGETLPSVTMAVLSKGTTCIDSPAKIAGKKIAVPPGTTQSQMFPAYLKINNIDAASFTQINAAADTLVAGLLADQFDGYVSYTVSNFPILTREGANPCAMLFSDHGVNLSPGETLITSTATATNKADLTQRMSAAVQESIDYAVEHPDEACDVAVKQYPDQMTAEVCKAATGLVVDQIKKAKADAAGKPFACISDQQITTLLDLLTTYAEFKDRKEPAAYYSNKFIQGC